MLLAGRVAPAHARSRRPSGGRSRTWTIQVRTDRMSSMPGAAIGARSCIRRIDPHLLPCEASIPRISRSQVATRRSRTTRCRIRQRIPRGWRPSRLSSGTSLPGWIAAACRGRLQRRLEPHPDGGFAAGGSLRRLRSLAAGDRGRAAHDRRARTDERPSSKRTWRRWRPSTAISISSSRTACTRGCRRGARCAVRARCRTPR